MPTLIRLTDGDSIQVTIAPVWTLGTWECGDQRFSDPDLTGYRAGPPAISVPRFKLLFTIPELITVAALRKTDPPTDTFMAIVDDPKTDTIDLSLGSVQGGIGYVLGKVYATDSDKAAERLAEILTGEVK